MIEVEVHQRLRAFLREQGKPYWPHHLTMARLVARGLRLGRSALIQVGASCSYQGRHYLSYLVPMLLWPGPVILVASEAVQQRLLMVEIAQLREWIPTTKAIRSGDHFPHPDFQGLFLTTPESWLRDRLEKQNRFPDGIPTILEGVDDLENWVQALLTISLQPSDWNALMLAYPGQTELIRDVRVQLTRAIFQRPANPYECYLIEAAERQILEELFQTLHQQDLEFENANMPIDWQNFWKALQSNRSIAWSEIARLYGHFSLHCQPIELSSTLTPIWQQQPVVLVGGALDIDADAAGYRQRVGLTDLTCLKFLPDRQEELIHLYLPDRLPMPNTPQFQDALLQEMHTLLRLGSGAQGLTVLLVDDVPLKAQVGSVLAAEFGSRVQVERTCLDENGVLVTGWKFWRQHQRVLPTPQLLAIATLPIPSLEDPLVAGRVSYYKQLRQDWFRLYLLPEALGELQRAIAPVRERQGVVALLDNRVIHRSYGSQILASLNPYVRISYLDVSLFTQPDYSMLD